MKTILITALATLLLAAPASAKWDKRIDVPAESVAKWKTPQRFSWTDPTIFRIRVHGRDLDSVYRSDRECRLGWAKAALTVEAQMSCGRRSRVTLRFANLRERTVRVRVTYWDPRDPR